MLEVHVNEASTLEVTEKRSISTVMVVAM